MKTFQVWSEGYMATGEHGTAQYHGEWRAKDFKEACKTMMMSENWDMDNYYDEQANTYWACRFFDNEENARKAYG